MYLSFCLSTTDQSHRQRNRDGYEGGPHSSFIQFFGHSSHKLHAPGCWQWGTELRSQSVQSWNGHMGMGPCATSPAGQKLQVATRRNKWHIIWVWIRVRCQGKKDIRNCHIVLSGTDGHQAWQTGLRRKRGARVARLTGHLTLNFSSAHDLRVMRLNPVWLCAEQGACLRCSLSPSAPLPSSYLFSHLLSKKITETKKDESVKIAPMLLNDWSRYLSIIIYSTNTLNFHFVYFVPASKYEK